MKTKIEIIIITIIINVSNFCMLVGFCCFLCVCGDFSIGYLLLDQHMYEILN